MSYIRVFIVLLEGVVDVQHGQMVPVDVSETHLGLVRLFLRLVGRFAGLKASP